MNGLQEEHGLIAIDTYNKMKDLYKRTVYNVGYIGEGNYKPTFNNKRTKANSVWKGILQRCLRRLDKWESYKNAEICEEWHNFQNFAEWFYNNYRPSTMDNWVVDKDILVKGNKLYSPETCCFVPPEINNLFPKCDKTRGKYPIGMSLIYFKFQVTIRKGGKTINLGRFDSIEEAFQVYKDAKEKHIKEVADKWKGLISDKVYEAMYNYQVEITD